MVLGIFGAGGNGRSIYRGIEQDEQQQRKNEWNKIVFVDDVTEEKVIAGIPVLRMREIRENYTSEEIQFVISVGEPEAREKIKKIIQDNGYKFGVYVSSDSMVAKETKIGEGGLIGKCHISDNCQIGCCTYISEFCVVGHDVVIGDDVVMSPNSFIGGYTTVGNKVYIGPGAIIRDRVTIGDNAVIAPGAVVFKDVPEGYLAFGNPAKMRKFTGEIFH